MKKKRLTNLLYMLLALAVCLAILPARPVYADADTIEGFVMDAEALPDGSIGVLLVRGGSSSSGVVSNGTLWYGIYDPEGPWLEEPVGSETIAKEAALALDGDVAHVAYTTSDNKIAYTYQTDGGWSDPEVIESNNCDDKQGALSAPDIVIGSDGSIHIAYFDTHGAEDDYYSYPDAMHVLIDGDTNPKTVLFSATGWFSSPEGARREVYSPGKIVVTDSDYYTVYGNSSWNKWMGGSDTSYYVDFKSLSGGSVALNDEAKQYTIFEAEGYGSTVYALGYGRGKYSVIQCAGDSASLVAGASSNAIGSYAADMTLDADGNIYYAAAVSSAENNLLFYQNGEVSLKTAANAINGSHNKLATVMAGDVQYAIYTNTDGAVVVANLDGEDLNEVLPIGKPREDISGVEFSVTGYATGKLSGLVADEDYIIANADPVNTTVDQNTGLFTASGEEVLLEGLEPDYPVTLVKVATSDETLDSLETEFAFTRAETPALEAVQPAIIEGTGSIPTTSAYEWTMDAQFLYVNPDTDVWTKCEGAMTDLDPGTYYIRVAAANPEGEDPVLASDIQEIEIVEYDPPQEDTPEAVITATGETTATITLSGDDDDTYTLDGPALGGVNKILDGSETTLTGLSAGELYIIKNGNGTTTIDSDEQMITLTRADSPELTGTNPTAIGGNGSINTTADHEYTTTAPGNDPDAVEWSGCESALEVPAGTYYIRVKADGTELASTPVTITLTDPDKEATPDVSFNADGVNSGKISGLVNGAAYTVTLGEYTETFTADDTRKQLTGIEPGTLSIVRKGDGGVTTVDSDPKTITITRAQTPELTPVNPTNRGKKGSIPTTSIHEFTSTDPANATTTWFPCMGTKKNLEAGTYYVRVKANGTVLASGTQTIVLTIENTYYVSFNMNGHGAPVPERQDVRENTPATEPGQPAETGFTFGGWYKDAGCGEQDKWNFADNITKDTGLYAKWTANAYTVAFDANGGGGSMQNQARSYNDGYRLSACTLEAPDGYEFDGWNTAPDGSGTAYADQAAGNLSAVNNATVTLYAQWALEDWGDLADADIQAMKDDGKTSKDVQNSVWIGVIEPVTYTSANIVLTPDQLHVYDGKTLLMINEDYTVKYTNQKIAHEATGDKAPTVTITGKGNYEKKTLSAKFAIEQKDLNDDDITWTIKNTQYKQGRVQELKPVIKYGKLTLKAGTDYDIVSYDPENPTEPGTVKVKVRGKGNYAGEFAEGKEPVYHIYTAATDLNKAVITIDPAANLVYPGVGETVCPQITVTVNGGDVPEGTPESPNYVITYKNNDKVGTATVTVTGKNNYCGSKSASFKITTKPVSNANTDIRILGETVYTGKQLKPEIDVYDTDRNLPIPASCYSVTYKNSTNVSDTPDVTVKFKGNYSGTATDTFSILPCELYQNDLQISVPDVKIKKDGDPVKIKPVVKYGKTTLVNGKDYSIEVQEHPEPMYGELWLATVTPKGNYKLATGNSPYKRTFRVYKTVDDIGQHGFEILMDRESFTYDGSKKTTGITVVARDKYCPGYYGLKEGQDYTITYTNNVNVPADNAPANKLPTVTVKGKGAYKGKLSKTFEIEPANLETMGENLQITVPDMKCTGRTLKPKVTVTLNGKALKPADYTVTFSDTTAATDDAKATIAGKGNYKGTKEQKFRVYKNDISKMTFDKIADHIYTGEQLRPGENDVTIGDISQNEVRIYADKVRTKPLHMGTDYTLEWGENVKNGNGTVTVKGIGDYGFSKTLTFKIKPKPMSRPQNR
ncbi:MAG: InlB B-repeat-containing protein [Lachnospiraceae bacterium]|nr:InlB B-repeat-containing protein [Lachnospiraceae bacterium]